MGMLSQIMGPKSPLSGRLQPIVKPLPQNSGKAEKAMQTQAGITSNNGGSILTSPLGVGYDSNSSTSLLGS